MEKLLAAGASIIVRPCGSDGFRFITGKYAVAVEYHDLRNAIVGNDLEEIFARLLDWVEEVQFYSGTQWTPEQIKSMERACR